MCLSDCQSCKFLARHPHHSSDIVCSLNPAYATAWKRLKSLDRYTKSCLPIDDCTEFEFAPRFEEKAMQRGLGGFLHERLHQEAIALNLSFFDWQQLARESSNLTIVRTLRDISFERSVSLTREQWQQIADFTRIPAVRTTLETEGIEPDREP